MSWLLLHNWVKEARQLAKEEDKVYAELREQVKKDVANVDENLRARAKMKKEEIECMKGRPMGPAALMSAFSDERAVSWRVKECLSRFFSPLFLLCIRAGTVCPTRHDSSLS